MESTDETRPDWEAPLAVLADTFATDDPVNALAVVLMRAWATADPASTVSQHPASFVATFADMARAVLALPAPHPQGGTGDAPTKTALDLQRDPDAASQLRALSGAETPCCGMCDDECDCVDAQTCLSDWRERAEKAEHRLSLLAPAPAPTEAGPESSA